MKPKGGDGAFPRLKRGKFCAAFLWTLRSLVHWLPVTGLSGRTIWKKAKAMLSATR